MSTYFEKINPYGQPDRKKTVFFLDDFPKGTPPVKKDIFFQTLPEKGGGPCPILLALSSLMS